MNVATPAEMRLTELDQQIEQLRANSARIRRERAPFVWAVTSSARHLEYLQLLRWLRQPATSYSFWRTGLLLIVPVLIGILTFFFVDSIAGSFPSALIGLVISGALVFGTLAILFFCPSDCELPSVIAESESRLRHAEFRLHQKEASDGLAEIEHQLQVLLIDRRQQMEKVREEIASGKKQRIVLLHRNWKALRGNDWERYLVEVFTALGGKVEHTGKCGDQGCDMIVVFGDKRIAIQAKGFDEDYAVNHKAVQEAYAGMAFRSCSACAVITNTRFRKSAKALADCTRCMLIGENEFPDFVMGRIDLTNGSQINPVYRHT